MLMRISSLSSVAMMVSLDICSRGTENYPIRLQASGYWESNMIALGVVDYRQLVYILSRVPYERVDHYACVSCFGCKVRGE